MNPLCCSTLQYAAHGRRETFRAIAELGFPRIDVWASGYLGTQDAIGVPALARHLDPAHDAADTVRRELAEFGLTLDALSIYRCDVEGKLARLDYAAALGTGTVIFCAERVPFDVFVECLGPVARRAEALGLKLAIENHIDRPVDTIASMERLVRALPSPAVGFTLAPPHLAALGQSAADAVDRLRERIFGVYLWDFGRRYRREDSIKFGSGEEQMPGGGQLDFAPLLRALATVGYAGSLNIAVHGTEEWPLDRLAKQHAAALAHVRSLQLAVAGARDDASPPAAEARTRSGR